MPVACRTTHTTVLLLSLTVVHANIVSLLVSDVVISLTNLRHEVLRPLHVVNFKTTGTSKAAGRRRRVEESVVIDATSCLQIADPPSSAISYDNPPSKWHPTPAIEDSTRRDPARQIWDYLANGVSGGFH